ncbi:MAG: hypothetical protein KAR19_05260 [Bacteroidales bacterium]|nr:hypothetical protein [Bacteroidales bacterium]
MKRTTTAKTDLEARFVAEKMDNKKLNFLRGGDGDGGEGATSPWPT